MLQFVGLPVKCQNAPRILNQAPSYNITNLSIVESEHFPALLAQCSNLPPKRRRIRVYACAQLMSITIVCAFLLILIITREKRTNLKREKFDFVERFLRGAHFCCCCCCCGTSFASLRRTMSCSFASAFTLRVCVCLSVCLWELNKRERQRRVSLISTIDFCVCCCLYIVVVVVVVVIAVVVVIICV